MARLWFRPSSITGCCPSMRCQGERGRERRGGDGSSHQPSAWHVCRGKGKGKQKYQMRLLPLGMAATHATGPELLGSLSVDWHSPDATSYCSTELLRRPQNTALPSALQHDYDPIAAANPHPAGSQDGALLAAYRQTPWRGALGRHQL